MLHCYLHAHTYQAFMLHCGNQTKMAILYMPGYISSENHPSYKDGGKEKEQRHLGPVNGWTLLKAQTLPLGY